jgi:hypothetical protein
MNGAGVILDLYDDVYIRTVRDLDSNDMEKVASVHPMTDREMAKLPDRDFALVITDGVEKMRKFAIHEPGHVTLSGMYFEKNAHKLTDDARKTAATFIKRACVRFGLPTPVAVLGALEGQVKVATNRMDMAGAFEPLVDEMPTVDLSDIPDEDFAYVIKEAYDKTRMYPMQKEAHVLASVRFFGENWRGHQADVAVKIAQALLEKAASLGVDLSNPVVADQVPVLKELSEPALSPDIKTAFMVRKDLVEGESRKTLDELYEKRAEVTPDVLVGLLSKFDEMNDLGAHYESGLGHPSAMLDTEKTASQVEYMDGSRMVGVNVLKDIDPSMVEDAIGKEAADKWKEDPVEAFKGLSEAGKDMLVTKYTSEV